MKRFFLPTICTLALLLLAGNSLLVAQQEPESSDNVIIIQKQKGEDGTVTVKKKRIAKGEALDVYVKELELDQKHENDVEVIIVGEGDELENAESGETLMFIRGAGEHKIKISGLGDFEKEFEKMKLDLNDLKGIEHQNHHNNYNYNYNFDFDHGHHNMKMVETKKTFLGVYPETGDEGVLLTGVVDGSGAKLAGLKTGDVMTSINGSTIRSTHDLGTELAKYKANDVVTVAFLRDGKPSSVRVTLSEKLSKSYITERDPCRVFIGVYVGSYGHGEEGVGVNGIVTGSEWPAEVAGLRKGDRIVALDGMPVYDQSSLVTERDKHEPGEYFTITYLRDGEYHDVEAQFKSCPKEEANPQAPVQEKIVEEALPAQPIEFINNELQLEELAAYPNPTYGNLNVRFQGEAVPTTVTVTDIIGKVVYNETIQNFDGFYSKLLDVSSGAPGNLVLSVRQSGKITSVPVVLLNRA